MPSRFCPAPWINISTDVNGSIRPCCRYEQPSRQKEYKMPWMKSGNLDELYNGPEMNALRQAFIDGKEPSECNWCWKEEETGIESFRELYTKRNYSYDLDNPIPQMLDLKLSNVCNLKCRMCGSQASSSIAKEQGVLEPYHLSDKIIGTSNEQMFFEEWLPNIQELELTGGEPFFSSENKRLISRIADSSHAKHIDIKITTNGMFYIPKLMEKMAKFKKVRIPISIDDIGPRLEYARDNSKWELIKANIFSMTNKYPNFDVTIYRTINNFNIYYLDELDDWAQSENIGISNGILHEPRYLSIQNLPVRAKNEVLDKFGSEEKYKSIISFMNVDSADDFFEFRSITNKLDKKRKQSFVEIFPEWEEILLWK